MLVLLLAPFVKSNFPVSFYMVGRMPITVYLYDENSKGLISIAEYGLEYGNENPIKVFYHGSGHYDLIKH